MMQKGNQAGFTLIELVMVIVIIGILAATALPKFSNLSKDARVASLDGLRGGLVSAANMAKAKCLVDNGCNSEAAGGAFPSTTINGNTIYFHYGYPTGWGRFFVDDGVGGIGDLMDLSGYTYKNHAGGSFQTVYTLDNAPDPDKCKLIYQMSPDGNAPLLEVTTETSGC